jgi:pimeloyl-ACP methyl ester carboxylesterase
VKPHSLRMAVADDITLAGDIYGEAGPLVLLLHGGGQTRHSWRKTAEALARAGYRALPFDQRGHGESSFAPDQRYSFFDYADDARALGHALQAQFNAPIAVVGGSLGGLAALLSTAPAKTNPFSSLVLVDVTPRMDPGGVAAVQGFMREKAREGFASIGEAAEAVAAYLPHRPKPRSHAGLARNLIQRADGRFYWHWDPAFLDGPYPIGHDAARVEREGLAAASGLIIPALLVRGAASELVRPEHAAEFLAAAPGAEFADVAEARHMVAGDSNAAFSIAVVDFLARRFVASTSGRSHW